MTDTAARPSPNENHLLINAYSTHPQSPLLAVTRRIADSGCNLVDTRLATVGRDVSVTALATGSWDAVAKLETMLTKLEREEGITLVWYRTGTKPVNVMSKVGDRFRDFPLGLVVERRGGLIEHQDGRIVVERARDRDALPLTAR